MLLDSFRKKQYKHLNFHFNHKILMTYTCFCMHTWIVPKHTFYIQYILSMSLTVSDIIYPTLWETSYMIPVMWGKHRVVSVLEHGRNPKHSSYFSYDSCHA